MYTYQAVRMQDSVAIDASANMQLTTLDTTSHNWVFSLDTLGDGSSSILYDVAIMSDSNIWAVGEIYLNDSSGQLDPRRYNLAIWDGTSWRIERLMYQGSPPVLRSVFAFAENDVWLDPWFHWNGQTFQQASIDSMFIGVGINKMWGSPDGRLYVVGNGGFIADRTTSGTWQRVESGTSAGLYDIAGYPHANGGTILAVVSSTNEHRILSLTPSSARDTLAWPVSRLLGSVWMSNRFVVYAGGVSVWRHRGSGWSQMQGLPGNVFLTGVRGSKENNIFAVSWGGLLAHFNGVSWHQFTEILAYFHFRSVAVSDNLVVAVGFTSGPAAAVAIGRRR
jgi:hypothetical protein